jgi:regulator of protease activity HflC (stomatin/prohibitin superfamily)
MLDRLIDLLLQTLGLFQFWTVLDEYERGVVLRLGRFHREIGPGFHWMVPMGIDMALTDNVVTRTDTTRNLTLTLRDGTTVVCSAVVRYNIRDVKKALLEVEGIDHVIQDCVFGNISDVVRGASWEDLPSPEFGENLTKMCRRQAWRYGVEIENVVFSDLCRSRSLSLMQG